jgi:hemin uptake protein HemP
MTLPADHRRPDSAASEKAAPSSARTVRSEELLRGERLLLIEHAGEIYRLQVTRNGKLILQK